MSQQGKMDPEVLNMILDTISKLEKDRLTLETKLEMDRTGEFPMELIRFMLGPEMALHLIFIPEEYGGLGAGATEIAVISERMAKMDLAIATSFLAICLGMDPLRVGATQRQKEKYVRKIAEEGLIVAYGVTEPEAGSNVQALKTKAERVLDEDGNIKGYKINGQKQFITNGGVADLYTILADTPEGPSFGRISEDGVEVRHPADTPEGPSFFVVEAGTEGLNPGKHEDKHGIRASDTCPLTLEDLYVPARNLVGGVEGQGLKQANEVFGYTRLMLATFGLGAGMASLERAISYSKERVQFGTPLSEKQGYTHKLLVPHAVQLEAARAFIEKAAHRLDSDKEDLRVEGSIAKYFATEAADAMANDGIQAFGGYGYMREYEVEKIKRDVRILPLYEGTSEIQRNIISLFRLRSTVRSKGGFYRDMAEGLDKLPEECGGPLLAGAVQAANEVILTGRKHKLTRSQYVMFLLADMVTWAEVGDALCCKADSYKGGRGRSPDFMKACARLFAREAVMKIYSNGLKIIHGSGQDIEEGLENFNALNVVQAMKDNTRDMDFVAGELVQ